MILSLEDPIGKGSIPSSSVKINIHLNKDSVLALVKRGEIELDSEALRYIEDGKGGLGILDYGTRFVDFFPHNQYVLDKEEMYYDTVGVR